MLLPTDFKANIADTFYDKSFTINRKSRSKDAEGGTVITTTAVGTYDGNVQYSLSSGMRQSLAIEARGLVDTIDLAVTTSNATDAKVDDQLVFNTKNYTVKGAFPFDSHLLLVCETQQ